MRCLLLIAIIYLTSCESNSGNSYNDQMNSLLQRKKGIETGLDSNKAKDERFRDLTGYNEMDDSLSVGTVYPNPELVDSIWNLKEEKKILTSELERVKYSIDSLDKLK